MNKNIDIINKLKENLILNLLLGIFSFLGSLASIFSIFLTNSNDRNNTFDILLLVMIVIFIIMSFLSFYNYIFIKNFKLKNNDFLDYLTVDIFRKPQSFEYYVPAVILLFIIAIFPTNNIIKCLIIISLIIISFYMSQRTTKKEKKDILNSFSKSLYKFIEKNIHKYDFISVYDIEDDFLNNYTATKKELTILKDEEGLISNRIITLNTFKKFAKNNSHIVKYGKLFYKEDNDTVSRYKELVPINTLKREEYFFHEFPTD